MTKTRSWHGYDSGSILRGAARLPPQRAPSPRPRAWSDRSTRSSIRAPSSRPSVAAGRASPRPGVIPLVRPRRLTVAAERRYSVWRGRGAVPADLLAVDAVLARDDTRIL